MGCCHHRRPLLSGAPSPAPTRLSHPAPLAAPLPGNHISLSLVSLTTWAKYLDGPRPPRLPVPSPPSVRLSGLSPRWPVRDSIPLACPGASARPGYQALCTDGPSRLRPCHKGRLAALRLSRSGRGVSVPAESRARDQPLHSG